VSPDALTAPPRIDPVQMYAAETSAKADVDECIAKALANLQALQRPDGSFEGEVVWCPMILAQYVILRALLHRPILEAERAGIIRHFEVTRRPEGGWGLHAESPSYVFVTTLAYVALRVLGLSADAPLTSTARNWLHAQPAGVLGIPSWGKFWLAMMGLHDYAGMNPCPPELFLLPAWSPVHPNHLYCHTRYIYLAISFLYGSRFRGDLGAVTSDLRLELFGTRYDAIDFDAHRHDVAGSDLYTAPSRGLRAAWNIMAVLERLQTKLAPLRWLRRRALALCLRRIRFEQEASNFQGLSPVSGILNIIALFANDQHDPMIAANLQGVESWRWDDADQGIRFAGARSTSWDTAFAMLAAMAGHVEDTAIVRRGYAFLDSVQEQDELAGGSCEARDSIRGGWCFSDGHHRWPVSDCAAEALSALLAAHEGGAVNEDERVPDERLVAAVGFILARQNADGGFATYERRRGPSWLDRLNPSEMFGDCMTELSYIECTASAVLALCHFRAQHPDLLRQNVDGAIAEAVIFLRARQRPDGSFPGFWGINFTYATWFAVTALRAAGAERNDRTIARAAAWLIEKQKSDGGWGEHYSGCLTATYVEHTESQAVMTSWAILALLESVGPGHEAVRRGIGWLCQSQRADGSWLDGAVNGVFFGSAMLTYRLYPAYFPLWALNRYSARVSDAERR
jgi:2,3-oxidosqualene cyclase